MSSSTLQPYTPYTRGTQAGAYSVATALLCHYSVATGGQLPYYFHSSTTGAPGQLQLVRPAWTGNLTPTLLFSCPDGKNEPE